MAMLLPDWLAVEMRTEIDLWGQNASEPVAFFIPALGVVILRIKSGKGLTQNLLKYEDNRGFRVYLVVYNAQKAKRI